MKLKISNNPLGEITQMYQMGTPGNHTVSLKRPAGKRNKWSYPQESKMLHPVFSVPRIGR